MGGGFYILLAFFVSKNMLHAERGTYISINLASASIAEMQTTQLFSSSVLPLSFSTCQVATAPQIIGKAPGTGGGPAVAAADRDADVGSSSGPKPRSQEDGLCRSCGGEGGPDRAPRGADSSADGGPCRVCRSSSGVRDQSCTGVGAETGAGAGGGDGGVLRVVPGTSMYSL